MNDKLDTIIAKLESLDGRQDNIDKTLAAQHEQLKHHIYRTDLLEVHVKAVEQALAPIKKHVYDMQAFIRINLRMLGVMSLVLGIVYGFAKFFS